MSHVEESLSNVGDSSTSCVVIDLLKPPNSRIIFGVSTVTTFADFYSSVGKRFHYVSGTFNLVLVKRSVLEEIGPAMEVDIQDDDQDSLLSPHLKSISSVKISMEIREKPGVAVEIVHPSTIHKNESNEGTSSNIPRSIRLPSNRRLAICSAENDTLDNQIRQKANEMSANRVSEDIKDVADSNDAKKPKFVGLVNQAMTCYLNSLIQTLYMTPEFRNAMYKWECDRNEDTTNSIHYQLQHLFLLMQTSNKESVETTGLTRSFGWDSSEAWQQHDIQELCRVMFDALEKTFQGTDQSDLIKRLYEGSMKDYVQCCECDHESARNDTFLDVPITIRPFGATTSYKSVMEGLNAFVEPETLDESNQYYCEKCAKKCDAKKGLKFIKYCKMPKVKPLRRKKE